MIDREIQILCSILLRKEDADPSGSMNPDRLIRLALRHRITYRLLQYAKSNREVFSIDQLKRLEERTKQNAVRSLMQLQELVRISREFKKRNISFVCTKGPQLARMLYGREALKESVDLDLILVNRSDLVIVHRLLTEKGYVQSNLNEYRTRLAQKIFTAAKREIHYFNPDSDCHIDLHVRIAANAYLTASRFRDFLSGLQSFDLEGTSVPVLSPEKYFVFLCYHGAMHQFGSLGWLWDIRSFIMRMEKKIDYIRVEKIAKGQKTERSLYVSLLLLKEMFGVVPPVPVTSHYSPHWSTRYLISACKRIWSKDAAYTLSLGGRINRLFYLMVLNKGMTARTDLIIGIILRSILPALRRLRL